MAASGMDCHGLPWRWLESPDFQVLRKGKCQRRYVSCQLSYVCILGVSNSALRFLLVRIELLIRDRRRERLHAIIRQTGLQSAMVLSGQMFFLA